MDVGCENTNCLLKKKIIFMSEKKEIDIFANFNWVDTWCH